MPVVRFAFLLFLLSTLTGCIEAASAVRVTSVKLTGVKAVKPGQLKSALATTASSKLPWGRTRYFTREAFEADLKRIVAFYKDRGFPDVKVASYDVKLNDRQDAVAVTVTVDEGRPIVVERLEYEGFESLPARHLVDLKQQVALKEHAPLDRALAQASREAALDELKDHGFPYAAVRLTDRAGSDDHSRVVTLSATPGTLARYGPIDIDGNTTVGDRIVERQLTIRPGRLFRLSQLQESQSRLYALETFDFVNIEPQIPEGEQPPIVPIKTVLTEGKHRKVNFGVGYGSEERMRGSFNWRHVNFLGGARTLQLESEYSALSKGVRLNLRQPYFFGPRTSLLMTAQSWHTDEPAYILNTNGGQVSATHTLSRRGPVARRGAVDTTFALTYTGEYQDYRVTPDALHDPDFLKILISLGLDPLNGQARGFLSSLAFEAHRSTADSTVNAKGGTVLNAHVEQAGEILGGDYQFTEAILEGRYYVPIAGRAVLAVKARAGSIGHIGGDNLAVPFYRRYFLGGATSLRGWGRFEVSPLIDGVMVGGHSMLESSAELRAPVWRNLSAVVFVDAGNVWNRAWYLNFDDLHYDIGPGVRYMTPIGPIRADLGFQVNHIPGLLIDGKPETRFFRFHFSIGQAF